MRNGKETIEKRYYISSLPVGVKRFARAVRGHWGIENSCHWSLDMTFREDESRIRDRHLRENFAWLNRFLLSLLKQHPSKNSIVGRRRGCALERRLLTGSSYRHNDLVAAGPAPAPIWLNNSLIGKCSLIRPSALPDRSAKTVGIAGALTFAFQHRNLLFLRPFQSPHEVLRGEIRTHRSGATRLQ